MSGEFEARIRATADAIESTLGRLLPRPQGDEARLMEAMRYATLGGGKRLRPYLAVSSAGLFGVSEQCALRVAAAGECVHCYSLVHDDLPAMDDDDLRRGRPSTHVAFDEATAILAGDALLALAFEILAGAETHADPKIRINLVAALSQAAGAMGMVGGQMLDIAAESKDLELGAVTRLQRLKTGEMFAFACESGAILGRAEPARRAALRAFAHDLGLAYQIADDLLDIRGRMAEVGKPLNKDAKAGKATFIAILGVDRAEAQAKLLVEQAIRHLDFFDNRADPLREVAQYVIERRA